MNEEQRVTMTYKSGETDISFGFNVDEKTHFEVFMNWVRFMNAIGYVLDPVEMERMWNE